MHGAGTLVRARLATRATIVRTMLTSAPVAPAVTVVHVPTDLEPMSMCVHVLLDSRVIPVSTTQMTVFHSHVSMQESAATKWTLSYVHVGTAGKASTASKMCKNANFALA
jgi:hypothetical protein